MGKSKGNKTPKSRASSKGKSDKSNSRKGSAESKRSQELGDSPGPKSEKDYDEDDVDLNELKEVSLFCVGLTYEETIKDE